MNNGIKLFALSISLGLTGAIVVFLVIFCMCSMFLAVGATIDIENIIINFIQNNIMEISGIFALVFLVGILIITNVQAVEDWFMG